jgi:hypothetical protein
MLLKNAFSLVEPSGHAEFCAVSAGETDYAARTEAFEVARKQSSAISRDVWPALVSRLAGSIKAT